MTSGQLRSITLRGMPVSPVILLDADGIEYLITGTRRRQRTRVEAQEDGTAKEVPDGPPLLILDIARVGRCHCAEQAAGEGT